MDRPGEPDGQMFGQQLAGAEARPLWSSLGSITLPWRRAAPQCKERVELDLLALVRPPRRCQVSLSRK